MGRVGIVVAAAVAAAGLAACEPPHPTQENRPVAFLEALLTPAIDNDRVREYADLSPAEGVERLIQDLPTKVAVDYLRTRQKQGVVLRYEVVTTQTPGATDRKAQVRVFPAAAAPRNADSIRFRLDMKDVPGRGWLVTRVQVE